MFCVLPRHQIKFSVHLLPNPRGIAGTLKKQNLLNLMLVNTRTSKYTRTLLYSKTENGSLQNNYMEGSGSAEIK